MHDIVKTMITLLAVINPTICTVMLLSIDKGHTKKERLLDATKISLSVLAILLLSALIGRSVLQAFGISVEAFQIVGGVIIASIGFSMFSPKPASPNAETPPEDTISNIIMFAASPGTIATVVALSAAHDTSWPPVITLAGVLLAVAITWIVMLIAALAPSGGNKNGSQQVITRFLGLILISMGLQFVLTGIKQFFFISPS
ncbi:MarC family protein [Pontiellaceae bacterium B1224]|nr:MarC family protein [Pontiellaceae bacterium B1224]